MSIAPRKSRTAGPTDSSDSRLVKECLQGSAEAWSKLIDKYKNLIFSIPVRYGFSEQDCADIFQIVCMDLLTELPRLREPGAIGGWLVQIARNKCFHRKEAQQRYQHADVDEIEIPSMTEDPVDFLAQTRQEQMLREALLDLSPRCRKLVHMLFLEDPARPYLEVARGLDVALGSIGFIRRRCLDKLRERLEKLGS
jgi:RNA polymerase sigma factor (sigma-70 family)